MNFTYQLFYYRYLALGPVWAETRFQSGDWYGSGMLHPGQLLRGSLPLLSPPVYIHTQKRWKQESVPTCISQRTENMTGHNVCPV